MSIVRSRFTQQNPCDDPSAGRDGGSDRPAASGSFDQAADDPVEAGREREAMRGLEQPDGGPAFNSA
jgi:hypothetical protein